MPGDNPFGNPEHLNDDFELDLPEDDGGKFYAPAGDYLAVVTDLVKGYSKAGNPMWTWTFQIQGNMTQGGKEFKTWTVVTPAAMWKLREVVVALGLGAPGAKMKFSKSDAIGRYATIVLEDDEYEGRKQSKIGTVKPAPDQYKGKRVQLASSEVPA